MKRRLRGQALLMVTFAVVPMMGIIGMVVDLGYMHYLRKSAQAAADAGALASIVYFHSNNSGASFSCSTSGVTCKTSYSCPSSISSATDPVSEACLYAKQNGFINSGNQTVTIDSNVTSPPTYAPNVKTAAYWVTVTVAQTVPQLFSAVQGNTSGKIQAQATAAVAPSKDCIYVLDPSDDGAYYQNGNTTVQSACGIYDNSSSNLALYNSGNSTLNASEYDIVGNYQWHGTLNPTPSTGAASTPDPLKNLQAPAGCSNSGGCDSAAKCGAGTSGKTITKDTSYDSGTTYFCGGLSVKNANVTFNGGTYVFVGGGLSLQDTNSTVTGSGLFYNTYDANHAYTPINFPANSTVTLSAPTSGTYAGILFMQDRHCCSPTTNLLQESFQGGTTTKFEGTLYFPDSQINFAGNPSLNIAKYTLIVAWKLAVQGTSYINNDYTGLTGGSPIQQIALIQ